MNLATPVSGSRTKQVHTPPSINGSSPSSRPVKKVSDGVLGRMTSSLKAFSPGSALQSRRSSRDEVPVLVNPRTLQGIEDSECYLSSNRLNTDMPITGMKQRRKTPTPLILPQLNTPPSTVVKSRTSPQRQEMLDSPLCLKYPKKQFSEHYDHTPSKFTPRTRQHSYQLSNAKIPGEAWMHAPRRPNAEDEPSTVAQSLEKNLIKISGPRYFVSSECSVCGERLETVLSGEKIVELSCDHQCHLGCFQIAYESTMSRNKFPICELCSKESRPKSEDLLAEMTAKILIRDTVSSRFSVESEWYMKDFHSHSQEPPRAVVEYSPLSYTSESHELKTPFEQLIKNSDFSCHGFHTPVQSQNTLARPKIITRSTTSSWFSRSSIDENASYVTADSDFSFQPSVHILPQLPKLSVIEGDKCTTLQYVINAFVPKLQPFDGRGKKNDSEMRAIKTKVNVALAVRFENTSFNSKEVLLFDRMEFSQDGDTWAEVEAYLFENNLAFFQGTSIVADIPLDQISQLHPIDAFTVVLNLKMKSLHEAFINWHGDARIMKKWTHYLKNASKRHMASSVVVPLQDFTTNGDSLLPDEISNCLRAGVGYESGLSDVSASTLSRRVSCQSNYEKEGSPLKIVLCLSLINCKPLVHSNAELLILIVDKLHEVLISLSDADLVGIILVGRDGAGKVGPFGTFLGMVSKNWDGWSDFFQSLKVYDNNSIFLSDSSELMVMLETSNKLLSTNPPDLAFQRHLVILGSDRDKSTHSSMEKEFFSNRIRSLLTKTLRLHKFTLLQYCSCNSGVRLNESVEGFFYNVKVRIATAFADIDMAKLFSELHDKSAQDLVVDVKSLDERLVQFSAIEQNGKLSRVAPCSEASFVIGPLRPGETKNIVFQVNVNLSNLRKRASWQTGELLGFSAQWASNSCLRRFHGFSHGCEIRFSQYKTKLSNLQPTRLLMVDNFSSRDSEVLDISFAPPLSAAQEALFVSRHIDLTVVEALRALYGQNSQDLAAQLHQLVSIIFCLSRNCLCAIPSFYQQTKGFEGICDRTEKLCLKLESIAGALSSSYAQNPDDSLHNDVAKLQMLKLATILACQDEWSDT
ncbi:LAMI_0G13476g1_1 [Lachancea mirantina]|uniref:LAMI_0G13476g1_1 n=1 Tax=Lachancea mirantina TaxID=1230905 RepID=A0A1G4KBS1_9SACH|nr:LAMI_0G13476g1_1 [Lachancea mirantina]